MFHDGLHITLIKHAKPYFYRQEHKTSMSAYLQTHLYNHLVVLIDLHFFYIHIQNIKSISNDTQMNGRKWYALLKGRLCIVFYLQQWNSFNIIHNLWSVFYRHRIHGVLPCVLMNNIAYYRYVNRAHLCSAIFFYLNIFHYINFFANGGNGGIRTVCSWGVISLQIPRCIVNRQALV